MWCPQFRKNQATKSHWGSQPPSVLTSAYWRSNCQPPPEKVCEIDEIIPPRITGLLLIQDVCFSVGSELANSQFLDGFQWCCTSQTPPSLVSSIFWGSPPVKDAGVLFEHGIFQLRAYELRLQCLAFPRDLADLKSPWEFLLGGGFIFFKILTPSVGKMNPIWRLRIFFTRVGWNHQLDKHLVSPGSWVFCFFFGSARPKIRVYNHQLTNNRYFCLSSWWLFIRIRDS